MPEAEVTVTVLDMPVFERLCTFLSEVKNHAVEQGDLDLELLADECEADCLDRKGRRL